MRDRLIELLNDYCVDADLGSWEKEALADYLLNSGIIAPPCKVGQTIYKPIITSKGEPAIWEIIVTTISIDIGENGVDPNSYVIGHLKRTHCGEDADFCDFGKTVFLTRKEAEKALERREGEDDRAKEGSDKP